MSERDETAPCYKCGETGFIINCVDDMCHGQGWCIHGDNMTCPECEGEGYFDIPDDVMLEDMNDLVGQQKPANTEED